MYLNKNILMMLMITLRTLFKTTKDKKNVGVKEKELPCVLSLSGIALK